MIVRWHAFSVLPKGIMDASGIFGGFKNQTGNFSLKNNLSSSTYIVKII